MSAALDAAKNAFVADMESDPDTYLGQDEIDSVVESLDMEEKIAFFEYIAEYHRTVLQPRLEAAILAQTSGVKH